MSRLLVIGVDGADHEYVSARMAAGGLPSMAALAAEGSFGPLDSTCPPLSCPAWPTMTTGMAPGSLGVFDLTAPDGYGKRIVSGADIRAPRLWDYVAAGGGRSVVMNVPVTYPPRPMGGVIVTGFLSPQDVPFTHPADVGPMLAERFDYELGHEERRSRQLARVNVQRDAFLHLLGEADWDFAMLVFSVTDWAQHDHWENRRHIDRLFDEVDRAVGEIIDGAGADNVLVISDHGFTGARRILNANRVLANAGLLTCGSADGDRAGYAPNAALTGKKTSSGAFARVLGRVLKPRRILGLLHRLHAEFLLDMIPAPLWKWAKRSLPVWAAPIDWSRTKAYLYNGLPQTVNVNLAGREPGGIVEPSEYDDVCAEVTAALENERDPETGLPVVTRVVRRAEAFPGPLCECGPDLIFDVADDAYLVSPADHPQAVWHTGRSRGRHRTTGVYVAHGPAFARQTGVRARLVDMTPTCLHAMGRGVPEGIDGQVATVLLPPGGASVRRRQYDIAIEDDQESEQDMDIVRGHLRDLGYM